MKKKSNNKNNNSNNTVTTTTAASTIASTKETKNNSNNATKPQQPDYRLKNFKISQELLEGSIRNVKTLLSEMQLSLKDAEDVYNEISENPNKEFFELEHGMDLPFIVHSLYGNVTKILDVLSDLNCANISFTTYITDEFLKRSEDYEDYEEDEECE